MRINTNVAAINAQRNLSMTQDSITDSMAKLSSGFRINRAGDDAAGLGIANKLRADTRALTQASHNAEQANSLLQISEGGANTIQKMLERMKELATQAGSDNTDGDSTTGGRSRLQSEFKALQDEITRTVETTKFQGTQLLKGTPSSAAVVAANAVTSGDTAFAANASFASVDITGLKAAGSFSITDDGAGNLTVSNGTVSDTFTATAAKAGVVTGANTGIKFQLASGYTDGDISTTGSAAAEKFTVDTAAKTAKAAVVGSFQSFLVGSSEQYVDGKDAIKLDSFNLELTSLGIDSDTLGSLAGARTALGHIDAAIGKVSDTLGNIGASQNRLQYASDNLKTTIQNYSAAESVIRDLDMAEEMTKFSKSNILAQAGTAMLAQANQSSQSVLTLLRG